MRRRLTKLALWALLAGGLWLVVLGGIIWSFGESDHATRSDCIIVLGARVDGAAPSPVFEERIRHGISLHRRGLARKILFTGGTGDGQQHSEARVAATHAAHRGVPAADILLEEKSRTTRQNLVEARALMDAHGLRSAIIVSDPLHMKRAMTMAGRLGIEACSSPTPTTRYRSLRTRLGFLLREVYFHHHFLVFGQ